MDTKKGMRKSAELARVRALSWIFYFKGELNVTAIKTKLSAYVLMDSIITFILSSTNNFGKTVSSNYLFQQYSTRVATRRLKVVEEKFGVLYGFTGVFPPGIPPDTLWNDYGQRLDFLPKEHDVVFDVGAYIGDWAVIVGKHYKAKVIAVEPSERAFECLLDNIHLNGLDEQIVAVNYALSSEDGEISMHIDEGSGFAVSTTKPAQLTAKTQARTLDSLLKEIKVSRIDLLKIDTEGFEYEILKSATSTIAAFKPKIIVEVHSDTLRENVIMILLKNRYVLVNEKINFFNPYQYHKKLVSVLYFSPQ